MIDNDGHLLGNTVGTDVVRLDVLTPTLYWPMVEASLGIVGACLPSMRPLWKKYIPDGSLQRFWSQTSFRDLLIKHPPPSYPEAEKLGSINSP